MQVTVDIYEKPQVDPIQLEIPVSPPVEVGLGTKLRQLLEMAWGWLWPATITTILWILTPFLYLVRYSIIGSKVLWVRTFGDILVSDKLKCPACGIRQAHKMSYSETYMALLHICSRCNAEFASPTIVDPSKWMVERPPTNQERLSKGRALNQP
jgi:hypothetical protein